MEPLANLILRVTSALEDRVQQVFTGTYKQPRGRNLGQVLVGRCEEAVDASRSSNHDKGSRVMVVGSNVGTHQTGYAILPAPPGNPGPASVATLKISGETFVAGPLFVNVSVNPFINDICGIFEFVDGYGILLDGNPINIDEDVLIEPGPHSLSVSPADPDPDYVITWSGDCDVDGNFTATNGTANCTLTMTNKPFELIAARACDFQGISGAPDDDFENVTRDWSHKVKVYGPCMWTGIGTMSVVLPVTGVTIAGSTNVQNEEWPGRCIDCDFAFGVQAALSGSMTVDISVPLGTLIRLRVVNAFGSSEIDAFTVKGEGNPLNSGTGPC